VTVIYSFVSGVHINHAESNRYLPFNIKEHIPIQLHLISFICSQECTGSSKAYTITKILRYVYITYIHFFRKR